MEVATTSPPMSQSNHALKALKDFVSRGRLTPSHFLSQPSAFNKLLPLHMVKEELSK